ncbi:MAG: right-handed parallel beta-helix repeat-containing protein [Clostridia bacterium]|nr:right-handed parallel beta-helix repeat-containing protein [Clostridia bacterium]
MKRYISLVLALLLAISSLFALSSCNDGESVGKLPTPPVMNVEFDSISDRADLFYAFKTPEEFIYSDENAVEIDTNVNDSADDSAAINAAINAASGKAVIFGSGNYTVSSSVTVPADVTVVFSAGASVTVNAGGSFDVRSESVFAPFTQIFYGDGTVLLSAYARLEWFGGVANNSTDNAAAFKKAFAASKTVYLANGSYCVNGSVELPDHDISIIGAGLSSSYIISNNGGKALFTNKTVKGDHDIHIAFLRAQTTSNPSGTFLDYKGTGKVTVENVIVNWFAKTVVLENAVGSHIRACHFHVSGIGITAKSCKQTTVESTLVNDAEAFLRIDGGEDFTVLNSSGVWNHATDIEVKNFKNFDMRDSSTDLGYNAKGKPKNPYGVYFENVDGFKMRGCWIATNGGLSGMCVDTNPNVPHILSDDDRTGIYITNSQNGLIAGNSINNHTTGVKVVNSPANAGAIVIEGNSLNGNGKATTMAGAAMPGIKCAIYCKDTANVEISMNFLNRYNSGYAFADKEMLSEGNNVNLSIVGNSFSKVTSQLQLESQNPGAKFDSNMFSIY